METSRNPWEPSELSSLRIAYDRGDLLKSGLQATPLAQFDVWWQEIVASEQLEPNAMVLSTVDGTGQPTARTVLLKGVDAAGFRFFTNYGSRKARSLESNPRVALVFPWLALHRQVTVLGVAEPMSAPESAAYFRSRPRGSQLAAWASMQSERIDERSALDRQMAEAEKRWPEGVEIPMPAFWGGYLVRPTSVEFWQGRPSRLHDRLRYETAQPGSALDEVGVWHVRRYSP